MSIEVVSPRFDCDVLVIGGGVNGTGLARDLSLRGLKVILVERNDLAFGASGNSSGMIHGGPRYMLKTPEVTQSSCQDSGYVQAIAPHLIFRIPFVVPVYGTSWRSSVYFDLIEGFFRAYDDYQYLKRGKPHTRLSRDEAQQVAPGLQSNRLLGAVTFDEWGINGARLCAANALDAAEHGATIHTHTTATAILFERPEQLNDRGAVIGARVQDMLTGKSWVIRAKMTVNATGAWAPITGALANVSEHVRVRPGKGVHVVLDRRLTDVAVMAEAIDGRQIFVEPWENTTILGTTDDDEYGDLDSLEATTSEVRYLVEGCETVMPAVRDARIIGTTVGARPTIYEYGEPEDALSREHALVDHSKHGAPKLLSLIGGKLASYRVFAEEAADVIARALGNNNPCSTHRSPVPGGEATANVHTLVERFAIDRYAAQRLIDRHGTRSEQILANATKTQRATIDHDEPVLAAEIRYAVEHEFARTLSDVSRRTRLGLGPTGGARAALPAAILLGKMLDWTAAQVRHEAERFIRERARSRAPGIQWLAARSHANSSTPWWTSSTKDHSSSTENHG